MVEDRWNSPSLVGADAAGARSRTLGRRGRTVVDGKVRPQWCTRMCQKTRIQEEFVLFYLRIMYCEITVKKYARQTSWWCSGVGSIFEQDRVAVIWMSKFLRGSTHGEPAKPIGSSRCQTEMSTRVRRRGSKETLCDDAPQSPGVPGTRIQCCVTDWIRVTRIRRCAAGWDPGLHATP